MASPSILRENPQTCVAQIRQQIPQRRQTNVRAESSASIQGARSFLPSSFLQKQLLPRVLQPSLHLHKNLTIFDVPVGEPADEA
jgi:hypothetical protein